MEPESVLQCPSYPAPEVYLNEDDERECCRRLFRLSVMREVIATSNPYLTKETVVVRALQKLAAAADVSWNSIVEDHVNRSCVLDDETHREILHLYEMRKDDGPVVTLDEQQCIERVLGRDRARPPDLVKLAQTLYKNANGPREKAIWKLFAVDGFRSDDPKNYAIDAFKYRRAVESTGGDDAKAMHVRAVKLLYQKGCDDPKQVKNVLEQAWQKIEEVPNQSEWVRAYKDAMKNDSTLLAKAMEWRQQPATKQSTAEGGTVAKTSDGAAVKRKRVVDKKKKTNEESVRHFENVGKQKDDGRKRQKQDAEVEEEEVIEQMLSDEDGGSEV